MSNGCAGGVGKLRGRGRRAGAVTMIQIAKFNFGFGTKHVVRYLLWRQ